MQTRTESERRSAYCSLWALALAFGWMEASAVVYLREIAVREAALPASATLPSLQATLGSLPAHVVALELAREASTLVLLAAAGWLAGRRIAGRIGAFLVSFGVWDIAYYLVLRVVSGWPERLGDWDILFLIPAPWVAPVWAPVVVAALFVVGGTYLYWTADHERHYYWTDAGLLIVSTGMILAAFLAGAPAVMGNRLPERFPFALFWTGVVLGAAGFVRAERRTSPTSRRGPSVVLRLQRDRLRSGS